MRIIDISKFPNSDLVIGAAIRNALMQGCERVYSTLDLGMAFQWSTTPEGHYFWEFVYNHKWAEAEKESERLGLGLFQSSEDRLGEDTPPKALVDAEVLSRDQQALGPGLYEKMVVGKYPRGIGRSTYLVSRFNWACARSTGWVNYPTLGISRDTNSCNRVGQLCYSWVV